MVAMSSREALRGEEVAIFDRMAETMTSTQWAEFLKAPLEVAAAHGDVSLSQKLVAAGAKVGNALHGAIRERHEQVVIDLVENAAADVSAEDDDEETPLHVALRPSGGRTTFCCDGDCAWCERVVRLLLRKGADPNTIGPLGSPLHYACTYCLLGATTALLESGADLNVRVCIDCDDDSRSVLDTAAGQASADVVRVLIKHGADVGLAGPDGDTPLHHAAYSHFAEVADVLVEAGANIQVRNSYNQTPLHIAAGRLNLTMVRAFLKHGLDANDRCQFAQTPLHEATVRAVSAPRRRREAAGVVDLLLRSGADETLVDDDGNTAGDLANKELSEVTVDEDEDEESDDTDHESAVERVRELLANAPADKAWRRRGYWALCRTHPGRLEEKLLTPQKTRVFDRTRRVTRSSVRASRVVGEIDLKSDSSSSWAGAAVWVLGLGEDAIFRTIVGYL
eukprot:g9357.t1